MSSIKQSIREIHAKLLANKVPMKLVAILSNKSERWVGRCFKDEKVQHLDSAERVYFAAIQAIKAKKEMDAYDERQKAKRLETMLSTIPDTVEATA